MASLFFQGDTPHGLMKRIIYKKRLQGFIPKTQQSGYSTIIFDGFSGSGKYDNEWPTEIEKYGSPIIALRVAINYFIKKKNVQDKRFREPAVFVYSKQVYFNKIQYPMALNSVDSLAKNEVTLYFVEKNGENFKNLFANVCTVLNCYDLDFSVDCASYVVTVEVRDERFPVVCHLFWSSFQNIPCPTVDDGHYCLAFIDPFGFSLELDKIADFMGPHKDAIFNFMSSYVNRFVGQIPVLVGGLFGIDIPQEVREQGKIGEFIEDIVRQHPANVFPQATNVDILVNNFCMQLSRKVGSALNLVFEMKDKGNKQLYHLIFNTHNEKGYKHMKHIMVSCNQDEGFSTKENPKMELSDFRILKNNLEFKLSIEQDDNRIADLIFEQFKGQTVNGKEVEDYVEFETPFVFQKRQLKIIENKPLMTVMDTSGMPRRRGTYAHLDEGHIILTFMSELERRMAGLSITGH